jgi:hypothetical protein
MLLTDVTILSQIVQIQPVFVVAVQLEKSTTETQRTRAATKKAHYGSTEGVKKLCETAICSMH